MIGFEVQKILLHHAVSAAMRFTTTRHPGLDHVWIVPRPDVPGVRVVGSDNSRLIAVDLKVEALEDVAQPMGIDREDVVTLLSFLNNVKGDHVWLGATTELWYVLGHNGRLEGVPGWGKLALAEAMVDPPVGAAHVTWDPTLLSEDIGDYLQTPCRMWVGGPADPVILADGTSRVWVMPMREEG